MRRAKEESGRLAGFLSTVLKGLVDAEDKEQVREAWVKGWFGMVHPGVALCASTSPSRSVKADAAVFGVEF